MTLPKYMGTGRSTGFVSTAPAAADSGWVTPVASGDTVHIYVADAGGGGSDSNNGLTDATPKLTVATAMALLRDGYPDWLHVKRDSVFTDQDLHVTRNGRGITEPVVVTTYGAGARPLFNCSGALRRIGGGGTPSTSNYVHVEGMSFVHYKRNPDDAAFDATATGGGSMLGTLKYWTIQDCSFRFYANNLIIQKTDGLYCSNVHINRCNFLDSWGRDGAGAGGQTFHSQGLYCEGVDALTITECFFDHNGWSESVPEKVQPKRFWLLRWATCRGSLVQ